MAISESDQEEYIARCLADGEAPAPGVYQIEHTIDIAD